MVSDLRYGWKKLRKLSMDVGENLSRMQVIGASWVQHTHHLSDIGGAVGACVLG